MKTNKNHNPLPNALLSALGVGLLTVPAGVAVAHPLLPQVPVVTALAVGQGNTEAAADAAAASGNNTAAIGIYDQLIAAAPKKFNLYLKRGTAFFNTEQYDKAAKDYSMFIQLRPNLVEGYLNRAYAYDKLGKAAEGLADLTKVESLDASAMDYELKGNLQLKSKDFAGAIASFGKVPGARGSLLAGDVYAAQGKFPEAIAAYTKGIAADPKSDYGYGQRGSVYIASKQYDLAVKDFTQFIALAPNQSFGYIQRGIANLQLATPAGYTAAKADLLKYLSMEKQPDQVIVATRLLAVAQKETGDLKGAADSYSKVIAANNKDENSLFSRGMVYMAMKDYPGAIKDFNTYATAFPSGPSAGDAGYNLGSAYLITKEFDKAVPAFTTALRVDPKDFASHYGRLVANFNTKQFDKAVLDADQVYATTKNPKDEKVVDAYKLQALAYGNLAAAPGDANAQKAISTIDKYVALKPGDQAALDIQSELVTKWANADAQIATYTKNIAATKDPAKLFTLYLNRGVAYSQQNANDKAIADFTKASTLDPKDKDVFIFLAALQASKGDTAGSIASYTKAIALNPSKPELISLRAGQYIDTKDYAKADADLTLYMTKAGDAASPESLQTQAQLKRALLKPDEAIAFYVKHLAVEKDDAARATSQMELGQLYLQKKDYTNAVKTYGDYLDKKKDVKAHVARATAYRLSGDTAKAMEDANAALGIAPTSAVALTERGLINNLVGDKEKDNPDKAAAAWDASIADCDKAIAADAKYSLAYYCKGFAAYNNASPNGKAEPAY
ncbi:MAG: tetratricopeptide repeat protein, partial [Armatimonadetes bacterium]|nr:tetratricopeptide repeat protein [Armatimonadota bacterium]